jgi:cytochrome c5
MMVLMMKRAFPKVAVAAMAGLSAGVGAALNGPAVAQGLPDGNGKELVRRICVSCHDLSPITSSGGFNRREWEMVIQSMINMGADITDDEIPVLVNYLAASFPPKGNK